MSDLLSEEQYAELEDLLGDITSPSAGFILLGRELGASATGEDPEKRGRMAFNRRLSDLRTRLCENKHIKLYCSDANYADATSVAALIAGSLIASNFTGMNVLLVSCIAARLGLRNLCDQKWIA